MKKTINSNIDIALLVLFHVIDATQQKMMHDIPSNDINGSDNNIFEYIQNKLNITNDFRRFFLKLKSFKLNAILKLNNIYSLKIFYTSIYIYSHVYMHARKMYYMHT